MNFDDGGIEPPYTGCIVNVTVEWEIVVESNCVHLCVLHIQYFQKLSLLIYDCYIGSAWKKFSRL